MNYKRPNLDNQTFQTAFFLNPNKETGGWLSKSCREQENFQSA